MNDSRDDYVFTKDNWKLANMCWFMMYIMNLVWCCRTDWGWHEGCLLSICVLLKEGVKKGVGCGLLKDPVG